MKTDLCYSVNELAEKWHVKPLTVYRLLKAGKLQGFRIGRAIRIEQRAVDAFIAESRIDPNEVK